MSILNKFSATIDYLNSREAIVSLTDGQGDWSGARLVQGLSREDLYERGYSAACVSARGKGGVLDRYSRKEPESVRCRSGELVLSGGH